MALTNNPLAPVLESYFYIRDALTITDRVIDVSSSDLDVATQLIGTRFEQASRDSATEELLRSYDVWEDYIVLAFWAAFERKIIGFLSRRFPYTAQPRDTSEMAITLTRAHDRFVERGSIDERLNLFKNLVPAGILTVTHQIKDYRNWVAHQNPNRSRPKKVDAEMTFRYLSFFSKRLTDTIDRRRILRKASASGVEKISNGTRRFLLY